MERLQTSCPLCAATTSVVISRTARDGSPLTCVLCQGCGLAHLHPLPARDELAAFYRDRYRLQYKRTYQPKPHHMLRGARVALDRLHRLRGILTPGQRVLDVGCGAGDFLYLLRAAGCLVTGIEPNTGYAACAREELGLEVHVGPLEDQRFAPAQFDGVTLFHVLEHLPEPVQALSLLASWAGPRGFVAVEVPNLESRCEHPSHRFHAAHLFYFRADTLERCGKLSGLALTRMETSSDGGNLLAWFRPEPAIARAAAPPPNGFERSWQIEQERSALRYWLSPRTAARAFRRLHRLAEERLTARRYASRR
ncbi:MAG: class I SAM-dependent methyltransferase, partial [Acidobacteriales bacterium]